ncbi:MAG: hypothetical protein KGD64_03900 [Candidatus Heimdallarchaeota archaeon]|nr:hypothetical protein [Candidatus Heimdallarchaeota archaeon]
MKKTLLVYGTRYGATAKSADVIATVLREKFNHEVKVVKLSSQSEDVEIANYDNIIVGSSIAKFSWTKRAKQFLKRDFTGKKLFIFISSAAITYPALESGNIDKYKKWKKMFLDRKVRKANVKPTSTAVFGGWVERNGKRSLDNWKEEDMIKWAEEIGKTTL